MACTPGCGFCGRCTESWEAEDEILEDDGELESIYDTLTREELDIIADARSAGF